MVKQEKVKEKIIPFFPFSVNLFEGTEISQEVPNWAIELENSSS